MLQIWNLANVRNATSLTPSEFHVVLRCVSMAQNGKSVTRDAFFQCARESLPLPKFEGVPLPGAVSQAPPAAAMGGEMAGADWAISADDRARYDTIFHQTDTNKDGYIEGAEAVALLSKSGLDKPVSC